MSMEAFKEEPTEQDLDLIKSAVQQIVYILYQHENISRVNTLRALAIAIEQVIDEWTIQEGVILKEEIKSKTELSQVLFQSYLDKHVAVILSLIGHIAEQDKKAPAHILKVCLRMMEKKHGKGIILPNEETGGGIVLP